MNFLRRFRLKRLLRLFNEPPRDPRAQSDRICFMEERVLLPVKAFVIMLLFGFIYGSGTFDTPSRNIVVRTTQLEIEQARVDVEETVKLKEEIERKNASNRRVKRYVWTYLALSSVGAFFLVFMGRFNLSFIQWLVVFANLTDAIFLTAWTFETGALRDSLYWIFLGLIIRNAVSVPITAMQISLNLCVVACFAFAGIWDWAYVDAGLQGTEDVAIPVEALTVRLVLMALLMLCCYGVQTIFDNQRQAREDKEEFAARQQQLETAGRLAGEIAHQIKNPLSIITNSLYTLEKHLGTEDKGETRQPRQLEIIREEVERADRIITELMGYAQLAEGRVENLDVADEIERAIEQVFPPGSDFETVIERNIEPNLPALKMQRGHLNEILVNILKNSRDVQNGDAQIEIHASQAKDYHIFITIDDNGPGIPPERVEQVFEPYFTTKDSGSGLGLSIVKHNTEIYGGHVHVAASELHGARFEIELPTRTLMRLRS